MSLPRSIVAPVAIASVALAMYAGWSMLDVGTEYDAMADEVYLDQDGEPLDEREQADRRRQRLAAVARGVRHASPDDEQSDNSDEALLAESEVAPPDSDMAGPLTFDDAQAGFDYAMRRVERVAKRRRRIKTDQWERLYRQANDAFSAYSMQLDPNDVDQLAVLEDAHRRLKQGLKRVRVRGKKFAY